MHPKKIFKNDLRFCAQLEDYLNYLDPTYDRDEYNHLVEILEYVSNKLNFDYNDYYGNYDFADNLIDDYYKYGYNADWYKDDLAFDEFKRALQYYDIRLQFEKEKAKPKKVVIKYTGYEYDENTCTVTVRFSNNTHMIMNAVDFFMIESEIGKMDYKTIISQFAIEVLDNAS